jgi:CheY-like chemotaxis protein
MLLNAPVAAALLRGPDLRFHLANRRYCALAGGRDCRLVALTGYGQEADKLRSQACGFEQHLVKPISPGDAARVVAGT